MCIEKTKPITNVSIKHFSPYNVLGVSILIFLLSAATPSIAKDNVLQLLEKEFKKVVTSASPTVVKVIATTHTPQITTNIRNIKISRQSISSGIIFDKDGHIVTTTFDMIPNKIEIIFDNKKRVPAKVIGMDELTDLVVLKAESKFPVQVKRGDSKKIDTGSLVVTVANSQGRKPILSFGIVSGREFLPDHPCCELIKINATISPGNSGGAVVNTSGEVVGMILAVLSEPFLQDPFQTQQPLQALNRHGITFAVPIETVTSVATEIIKHGKVPRGWLGVNIDTKDFGVFVTSVILDSPAHVGGILPRDVILEFNNTPVKNYSELLRCVGRELPNTEVKIKIQRDGDAQNYTIKLGER